MSIKVLIIENFQGDYTTIRNALLTENISLKSDIYPRNHFADYTLDFKYNKISLEDYNNELAFMLELYKIINGNNKEEIFNLIFEKFNDIDIYIIDINLTSNNNKEGMDFYKFLVSKNIDFKKIFIVTPMSQEKIEIDSNSHFIQKDSANEFGTIICNLIKKQ